MRSPTGTQRKIRNEAKAKRERDQRRGQEAESIAAKAAATISIGTCPQATAPDALHH